MASKMKLTLTSVQAIRYNVNDTVRRSSKRSNKKVANYLISARGHSDSTIFEGFGEAQPRGSATGDPRPEAWEFLESALAAVQGAEIRLDERQATLDDIRRLMQNVHTLVPNHLAKNGTTPTFAATRLGLESALLDLAARAHQQTLAWLLGTKRDHVPLSLRIITHRHDDERIRQTLAHSGSVIRILGEGKAAEDIALIDTVTAEELQFQPDKTPRPLWIDLRGGLTPAEASDFLDGLHDHLSATNDRSEVIVEQPVDRDELAALGALQAHANTKLRHEGPRTTIRIMPDESLRSLADLERLSETVPCRALHLRPARIGGLLASLDIAQTAIAADPDVRIFLNHMPGASNITAASHYDLGMALPRIDTATITPKADADAPLTIDWGSRIAGTEIHNESHTGPTPVAGHDNPERPTHGAGIGLLLDREQILLHATNQTSSPPIPEPTTGDHTVNTFDDTPYLRPLGTDGTKGHLLEREALALGLSTTRFGKAAFLATDGQNEPLSFRWSRSSLSSALSHVLCSNKEATRHRLEAARLPVPQGRTFDPGAYDQARAYATELRFPVVVKPTSGMKGIAVTSNIRTIKDLDGAFAILGSSRLANEPFIVEEHVTGGDYRVIVIGEQAPAAILRTQAGVKGDGLRTISELMLQKNLLRRQNPHLWKRPVLYDDTAKFELQRADKTLDTVPDAGVFVPLTSSSSLSQGGDSIDVTDEVHPSIMEACIESVRQIPGLYFCGVDILLDDHTAPLSDENGKIIELNAIPAVGNCEYPFFGTPRQVAATFLDECARQFNLKVWERRADDLAIRIDIRGRVVSVGYRAWFARHARAFGLHGWVRNATSRRVEALIAGPTAPVTALATLAAKGPRKAVVTSVTTSHVSAPDTSGFTVELDEDRPSHDDQHQYGGTTVAS